MTERIFNEVLTLPLYFEMTDGDVDTVISSVQRFFEGLPHRMPDITR